MAVVQSRGNLHSDRLVLGNVGRIGLTKVTAQRLRVIQFWSGARMAPEANAWLGCASSAVFTPDKESETSKALRARTGELLHISVEQLEKPNGASCP